MAALAGPVLSIWAHPDDETYLAGGLMAAAVDAGRRVVCVAATAGERGTSDPATWPPSRLGQVRRWETAAAMAVLGVADHRFLDLTDGGLDDIDDDIGVGLVTALLDDIAPATILTFGADGVTFHPDHIAVSRWVTDAWEAAGRPGRLLHTATTEERLARFGPLYEEWGVYMTGDRPIGVPAPDLAVHAHLDGAALDRKLTALAAMASQTRDVMTSLDPRLFAAEVAEECFVEAARPAGQFASAARRAMG